MQPVSLCPSALDLQHLLRGGFAQADADALEQHVEGCTACQASLGALDTADDLVQTARAVANKPAATPPAAVDRLIARLAPLSSTTAGSAATVGSAGTSNDTGLDISAVLMPAQSPGELGRLGTYRILGVLGQGGMGIVFKAEDTQLQRQVALKVINPRLMSSATARVRFLREARSAAALEHDHVVPIYQVGEEGGVPYLAFPLLKGETLEDRLKRELRLPLPEILRIGREIAEGLHAAHACGLIHRDIKPANIWLEDRSQGSGVRGQGTVGRVKILDFGLARAAAEVYEHEEKLESAAGASLTHTGMVLGTPAYMAPEQARGGAVEARADLYSLGAVLYRMATGQPPFPGEGATAVLAALQKETPAAPQVLNPKLPTRLSRLILALLAKKPSDRPASASVVVESLAGLEQRGRRRWVAVAAAGLLAAFLAVAAFLIKPHTEGDKPDGPTDQGDSPEVVLAGVEFVPFASYDVGLNPCYIAIGDLNGDGKADLVVVNQGPRGVTVDKAEPGTISVLLGNGDGTFQPAVHYPVGRQPLSACIADLDGDGKADIAVTEMNELSTGFVRVLRGNGDGTFQPAVRHAAGGRHPSAMVAADFNGDGKLDLGVAFGFHVGGVSVMLGNGDGSFRPPVFYPTGVHTGNLTVADFNGDGRPDLAVSNSTSGTVSVLLGNGDGTFQTLNHRIGSQNNIAGAADFDGDGKLDLAVRVVPSSGEQFMQLLLGKGDGTFRDGPRLPGGNVNAVADFNGDRRADIVALAQLRAEGKSNLFLHLGKGKGAFQGRPPGKLNFLPYNVAGVGDLNGDGRPDLVVGVDGSNKVQVLLNRPVVERLSVSDATLVVGQPGWILVTAQDATGGTAVGYTGTVRMDCDGEQKGLPAEYTFTIRDKGVRPFDQLIFARPGQYTITATDAANPALRATGTITVIPR